MPELYCIDYGRVSTGRDEQTTSYTEQMSIDPQSAAYKWAKEKGLHLKEEYIFGDRASGTSYFGRSEFVRMMALCGVKAVEAKDDDNFLGNGNVDKRKTRKQYQWRRDARQAKYAYDTLGIRYIVCKNTSRWTRTGDVEALSVLVNECKIHVHFLDTGLDTERDGVSLILRIMAAIDKEASDNLSSRVIPGIHQSIIRNRIRTNKRIYGFKMVPRYDGELARLAVNEDEAKVVRLIFDLYTGVHDGTRYGSRQIAKILAERGYTTREFISKNGNKHGGKAFSISSVKRIVQNEKYAGYNNLEKKWDIAHINEAEHCPRKIRNYQIERCPEIEPIIDIEQFLLAQEILEQNRIAEVGIYKGSAPLAGHIRCAVCGDTFRSNGERNKEGEYIRKYNCSTKKKHGVDVCNNRNIPESETEELLEAAVKDFPRYLVYRRRYLKYENARIIAALVNYYDVKIADIEGELQSAIEAEAVVFARYNKLFEEIDENNYPPRHPRRVLLEKTEQEYYKCVARRELCEQFGRRVREHVERAAERIRELERQVPGKDYTVRELLDYGLCFRITQSPDCTYLSYAKLDNMHINDAELNEIAEIMQMSVLDFSNIHLISAPNAVQIYGIPDGNHVAEGIKKAGVIFGVNITLSKFEIEEINAMINGRDDDFIGCDARLNYSDYV